MGELIHFLNGSFVTEEKLLISPRDLGFGRGYAVADFIVTYNRRFFKLHEHVERLFKSAEIIGLHIPWSKQQIAQWAQETLDKNDTESEKTLKIIVSGGVTHEMYQAPVPTLIMIINRRQTISHDQNPTCIKVITAKYKRQRPEAKHTDYVEGIKQRVFAKDKQIDEIIYYDESQVFEGSGSNIFAVIGDKLMTPETNIVKGVTRKTLLEILRLPIPIVVKNFTIEDLKKANEIFMTGSNSELRSVVEMDGTRVGDGQAGPIAREALRQYRGYIQNTCNITV